MCYVICQNICCMSRHMSYVKIYAISQWLQQTAHVTYCHDIYRKVVTLNKRNVCNPKLAILQKKKIFFPNQKKAKIKEKRKVKKILYN
jgi:hypothetical protein